MVSTSDDPITLALDDVIIALDFVVLHLNEDAQVDKAEQVLQVAKQLNECQQAWIDCGVPGVTET